jgi:hypothetical protein
VPVAVYRVVDRHGETVREYVVGPVAVHAARQRAVEHATRIGGRVFLIDEHGHLELAFGAREAARN